MSFENILKKLEKQVEITTAYILVDDLNHLVKGGPLSNGSAILGNILSIKPILHFNAEGEIVVFEKCVYSAISANVTCFFPMGCLLIKITYITNVYKQYTAQFPKYQQKSNRLLFLRKVLTQHK